MKYKLIIYFSLSIIYCEHLSAQNISKLNILNNRSSVLSIKDSMLGAGWLYRDSFPYYFKHIKTGRAPKSCTFSPDGKYLFISLLNEKEKGIEVFNVNTKQKLTTITPACKNPENNIGYPEGEFNHIDSSYWFTRMTTSEFFVYKNGDIKSYSSQGTWPKVLKFDPAYKKIAISNWVSNTVTIFNSSNCNIEKIIKTGKTPRGIAWIDSITIAVALFGTGDVQIFNINEEKPIFTIEHHGGTARDVIYDKLRNILYFSDMFRGTVYKYSWEMKKMLASCVVDLKANTIKLSPDGNYLMVSCRGPNNPDGYIYPSIRNGKLFIIKTSDFSILESWYGGNQPTGLDISPDGKYMATTDFQESRLNIFKIGE